MPLSSKPVDIDATMAMLLADVKDKEGRKKARLKALQEEQQAEIARFDAEIKATHLTIRLLKASGESAVLMAGILNRARLAVTKPKKAPRLPGIPEAITKKSRMPDVVDFILSQKNYVIEPEEIRRIAREEHKINLHAPALGRCIKSGVDAKRYIRVGKKVGLANTGADKLANAYKRADAERTISVAEAAMHIINAVGSPMSAEQIAVGMHKQGRKVTKNLPTQLRQAELGQTRGVTLIGIRTEGQPILWSTPEVEDKRKEQT